MNSNNNHIHSYEHSTALNQLKANWFWYLLLGAGLITLGMFAIGFSLTSTIISMVYLGMSLVVIGFFEGIKAIKINKFSGFFLHLFLSVLYIIGGIFIIFNPAVNALTFTLLLSIFFMVSGILRIGFAFASKVIHKGWLILNGLVTFILGLMIFAQWPYSGLWVIGTFIGIDMIISGWTWVILALRAKNIKGT